MEPNHVLEPQLAGQDPLFGRRHRNRPDFRVSALAGLSPNAKIQAGLTTILANSANPAVIADEVKQIAEIPNVPAAVLNLLPALSAATSPTQVVQMVQAIETVMGGAGLAIG